MSLFFRNLNNFAAKRENAIKEVLVETLAENFREIQYDVQQRKVTTLELCEGSSSLCTTLEAIFLHGLKDSLLWQTVNAIAGDEERRPEPSFWSPLLVFLHKQVIVQIQTLSQITSEIGQCRVWIRLSLNESLFSAYLNNMRKNSSALSPYYKRHALMRDRDCLEKAAMLMEELEAQIEFRLPLNSSLLNQWPDSALQISGVWTPTLKSCPISNGVDAAETIDEAVATSSSAGAQSMSIPTPQPLCTTDLFNESISNSPFGAASNFGAGNLEPDDSDELLKRVNEIRMGGVSVIEEETHDDGKITTVEDDKSIVQQVSADGSQPHQTKAKSKNTRRKTESGAALTLDVHAASASDDGRSSSSSNLLNSPHAGSAYGNCLKNRMQTSWSPDVDAHRDDGDGCEENNSADTEDNLRLHRSLSRMSFNAILVRHEQTRSVDFETVWAKFLEHNTLARGGGQTPGTAGGHGDIDESELDENTNASSSPDSRVRLTSRDVQSSINFENISAPGTDKFDVAELQDMVKQLCRLARESGVDVQGFMCKSCTHPLIVGFSNFQVCAFNGGYYCSSCMDLEPVMIPAKIIYNGDFGKYLVSKRAMAFLAEFRNYPFLDMKLLNPNIYNASEAMAELQCVRIRLNFIRAYMCTCCPETADQLRVMFYGREYLYETIHHYSIGDLAIINRNTLLNQLKKLYKCGEKHVLNCAKCSVKGFICEICNSQRVVLYPFHIETTFRCETCGSVFHAGCLNANQPCPRCERRRRRECLAEASLDDKEM